MDRIAIFQYEWPLQVHTNNIAVKLAESGFFVDLFLKDCSHSFIGHDELRKNKSISVYDLSFNKFQRAKTKIIKKILGSDWVIANNVFTESLKIVRKYDYKYLIGIEKRGLIWAGKIAEIYKIPYLYYSLELYLEDHIYTTIFGSSVFKKIREMEKKYHGMAKATIIQDALRADVLLESNGIEQTDLIYIPVSILGEENKSKSKYFYDTLAINPNKRLILCFGLICEERLCFEIAEVSNLFSEDYVTVFHGPGSETDINKLKNEYNPDKVFISLETVPEQKIKDVISSATIGLVIYGNTCVNDRLTAFSSEKIARYLQSGIPIVAFNNESYRQLMDAYCCGELINHINEIPDAVDRIMRKYSYYRENAFLAYNEFYNFGKQFMKLKVYLDF